MRYFIPTKVYDEKNAVMNHACELALFGKKALIVTGKSSAKKCGALGDVMGALDSYAAKSFVTPQTSNQYGSTASGNYPGSGMVGGMTKEQLALMFGAIQMGMN